MTYRELLARALAHDPAPNYTIDDVEEAIVTGRMRLWPGEKSAVVTEIGEYPQGKVLHYFLAAGDLTELARMEAPIVAWAKAQGCVRATLVGRRGWARSFLTRDSGWRDTDMVLLEREL